MRQSKVKLIRRVMKKEAKAEKSYRFITHSKLLRNPFKDPILRYTFQYIRDEGKTLINFAKKVYKTTGVLPR